MVEKKPRVQKVLSELYDAEEPVRPREIADKIGETSLNVGRDLHRLKERGLAESEGEGQWKITSEGREWIEGGAEGEKGERGGEKGKGREIATETVPSQSDLFRSIGEKLGAGAKKGDVRLDAITYYVQRTADLDNLISVWNALTEMGVANDVKKRWIKIYAQNLPGKEIPQELKEKLESGELEKIKTETGEIPPKPKRFSVVGDQIIGDPEGDLNFKEALQLLAHQKGVPSEQASPLAAMVEAMKLGPDMATATLTAMAPLLTKESAKSGDTLSQALQSLKDIGVFGKEGGTLETIQILKELGLVGKTGEGGPSLLDQIAKLSELGLLKKPGEEGEGSETIKALETQIKELSESLRKQEMDTVKSAVVALSTQMTELRKEMSNQGKLEGRFALMDKAIGAVDNQLTGIRVDAKPLLTAFAGGGGSEPRRKSPEEKAKIAEGLKEATALEREARQLEDKLLFGGMATPNRA